MDLPEKRKRRQKEASLSDQIRVALNAIDGVRVWPNATGLATHIKETGTYHVRYGLGIGSPDLVGIMSVARSPDNPDVSLRVHGIGVFLGVEVKQASRLKRDTIEHRAQQDMWRQMIEKLGGIYIRATSAADAVAQLEARR